MSLVGIGDNSLGIDPAQQIKENLDEKDIVKDLRKRMAELLDAEGRVPEKLEDMDTAEKVSAMVAQCTKFDKVADATRVDEKAPYLAAERVIDGHFGGMRAPISELKKRLLAKRTAYDTAVYIQEQAKLKEQARIAAEEATRLRADAETAEEKALAGAVTQKAQEAKEAAAVRPAELTRTRSSLGTTSSLKREWKHRVIDEKKVPRKFCTSSDQLLRAAVKAAVKSDGTCDLIIAGVEIYEDFNSVVRG